MTAITYARPAGGAPAIPSNRQAAIAALQGEDAILSILTARTEAHQALRKARNPPGGLHGLEVARWDLEHLPPEPALVALQRDLGKALSAPADDRKNRVLVALMVDAFPNSRAADAGVQVETLLHDLGEENFAPLVVAQALRSLRKTERFQPGIAEVLTACTKVREEATMWEMGIGIIIDRRRRAVLEIERAADQSDARQAEGVS